jgi:hypothetical protein
MLGPDEGARAVSPYNGRRCDLRLGRFSLPGRPGREGGLSGRPYPRQLKCWGVDSAVSLMLVGRYNWAEAGWSTSPDIRTQLCVRGPWMVGHTAMKPAKQPAGSSSLSKTEERDPNSRVPPDQEIPGPGRIRRRPVSRSGSRPICNRKSGNQFKKTGKRVIRFPIPDWPGIGIRKWAISRPVSRERVH